MAKYVITGGPGVGKTTLLEYLQAQGHRTTPEAARAIIREQQPHGILPWTNFCAFQTLVLERQLKTERALSHDTFLDRGILDGIAYCHVFSHPVPPALARASRLARYDAIFLLDPLPNYQTDDARREDHRVAQELHDALEDVYRSHAHTLITIPVLAPEERAAHLLEAYHAKPARRA